MPNLLVVPVVLQMATATQVRTMRQVSDDPHADLRVARAMQGGRNRWAGGR